MFEYYIGEVRIFACSYAPMNWALCDGTQFMIQQFPLLFSVIGNIYGGDGKTTFAVPDLRCCAVQGKGSIGDLGMRQGAVAVSLTDENMPLHTHTAYVNNTPSVNVEGGGKLPSRFVAAGANAFLEPASQESLVSLSPLTVGSIGAGEPHNNMQPYLPLNFCICMKDGEFPPRQ